MAFVCKILRQNTAIKRLLSYQALYEGPGDHNLNPSDQAAHLGLIEKLASNTTNSVENLITGRVLPFSQISDDSLRTAARMRDCGVSPGDHVMLFSTNQVDYMAALLGIMSLGAVPCLANPGYTEYELGALCKSSDAKYIVGSKGNHHIAKKVSDELDLPLLFNVDELPDFISGSAPISDVYNSDPTDTAVIGYSSGTTGLPKAVQLTHLNLNLQRSLIRYHRSFPPYMLESAQVCVMPWYHAYGFTQFGASIEAGTEVKIMSNFDPIAFLGAIQKYRAEGIMVVPPILLFLAKHPIVEKFDLSSIRECFSGAAPLTQTLIEEVLTKHPNMENIRQGYGMTEVTAGSNVQEVGCTKRGSVGTCLPFSKLKIVDPDTDEVVVDGGAGEILLGGNVTMKGYYKNDKANAETMTSDGFIRTGDIGTVDEDGSLWITDRLKELIKVKGFQVAPAELEGILTSHPAILDAAVIGIPNDRTGEIPKAFVTAAPGVSLSEEDVKNFIASRMSTEKHLGAVEFMADIPKLPSGKILRKDLRKLEESRRK